MVKIFKLFFVQKCPSLEAQLSSLLTIFETRLGARLGSMSSKFSATYRC